MVRIRQDLDMYRPGQRLVRASSFLHHKVSVPEKRCHIGYLLEIRLMKVRTLCKVTMKQEKRKGRWRNSIMTKEQSYERIILCEKGKS